MRRRDFLKLTAAILVPLIDVPTTILVPDRRPFIRPDGLYSHLGIFPITKELNICEGWIREVGDWDGQGYPCLVENACTFGRERPRVWIYDVDLWNFRDDNSRDLTRNRMHFNSQAAVSAWKRFGNDTVHIANAGGGRLSESFARCFGSQLKG